jgi:2-oxoglutarate/2-oxoacid ferredoxin oxidoreductase subunit alpha
MARNMPQVGGVYLQAESEVAAINMVYGAAATGARVMTTSSSPGISLMQEGLSYIIGAEVPCVVVNVVRGGPGLGNIAAAQSDYWLATRGAGHGDGRCLTFAPYSVQEMHDWTARAFTIAEKYRNPVMILADGILGQMVEPCRLIPRGEAPPLDKPWAIGGGLEQRDRNVINSLYVDPDELEAVNLRIQARYDQAAREDTYSVEYGAEEPEILVMAYGISARVCETAVERATAAGVPCRLLRPISLFPFPSEAVARWAERVRRVLVVELSMGQFIEDVRLAVEGRCPVELLNRAGGNFVTPEDVTARLLAMASGRCG